MLPFDNSTQSRFKSGCSVRKILAATSYACLLMFFSRCDLQAGDVSPKAQEQGVDAEQKLIERINQRIRARWAAEKVVPAAPADDAEYLRRVYLDLAGQIPPVSEVRRFLEDSSPGKRKAVVQALLDGPRYIVHSSNVWRSELLPEVSSNPQLQFLIPSFEAWLKDQLVDNDSYADLARKLVTYKIEPTMATNIFESGGGVSPVAFYQAKEGKPESVWNVLNATIIPLTPGSSNNSGVSQRFTPVCRDRKWAISRARWQIFPAGENWKSRSRRRKSMPAI
jgi:hypothetical protein